jgi:hypothetical protein
MLNNKSRFLLDLQEKLHFKLEFVSRAGIAWADFKYQVTEKTTEEIANLNSIGKDIGDQPKKVEGEEGKPRHQSRGRDFKGRRGYPTQRKRYTRRGSNGPRPDRKGVPIKTANSDESKRVIPSSQSSAVIDAQEKMALDRFSRPEGIELSKNNDSGAKITPISRPVAEEVIANEPSIDSPTKVAQKSGKESGNFIKRLTGFLGKSGKREESPPSGTES